MTEDDEKAAMEWLDGWPGSVSRHHVETLKRMLDRPVLPEEPTGEALNAIYNAISASTKPHPLAIDIYRALYAHLTKPPTKTVHVVAWSKGEHGSEPSFDTQEEALEFARRLLRDGAAVRVFTREDRA